MYLPAVVAALAAVLLFATVGLIVVRRRRRRRRRTRTTLTVRAQNARIYTTYDTDAAGPTPHRAFFLSVCASVALGAVAGLCFIIGRKDSWDAQGDARQANHARNA